MTYSRRSHLNAEIFYNWILYIELKTMRNILNRLRGVYRQYFLGYNSIHKNSILVSQMKNVFRLIIDLNKTQLTTHFDRKSTSFKIYNSIFWNFEKSHIQNSFLLLYKFPFKIFAFFNPVQFLLNFHSAFHSNSSISI